MTEKEAKTKICHKTIGIPVQYDDSIKIPEGRIIKGGGPTYCIASACMAWRFHYGDSGHCGDLGEPP